MNVKPVPKVTAAAAGGGLAVILVWVAGLLGVDVPPEVAAAFTTVLSFAGGWIKR